MLKTHKFLSAAAVVAAALLAACAPEKKEKIVNVSVVNTTDIVRTNELVLVDYLAVKKNLELADTSRIIVLDEAGNQVPYQISANRRNVMLPATVGSKDTAFYTIQAGTPEQFTSVVFGKHYPQRVDDIAWENPYSAYRLYGPALQRNGEKAFGYDVWAKRVPTLVVDARYEKELGPNKAKVDSLKAAGKTDEAAEFYKTISYHVDHGDGLDCYKVGPTLGGGTSALYEKGKILYPYCYENFEILENGPLRFTVRLTYGKTKVGKDEVVEVRTISSEIGSRLNYCSILYLGLTHPTEVATGLVIHPENKDTMAMNMEHKYIAYADLTDNAKAGNGVIYVGAVCPSMKEGRPEWFKRSEERKLGASGHVLAISDYKPQTMYQYWFGSSWSKYDMPDMASWEAYLADFATCKAQPLQVTIE